MNIENKLLKKRDCLLEIELITRVAGWTNVCLTTGGERLFFHVSNVSGVSGYNQVSDLGKALYFLSPDQNDIAYVSEKVDRICYHG